MQRSLRLGEVEAKTGTELFVIDGVNSTTEVTHSHVWSNPMNSSQDLDRTGHYH